MVPERHSSSHPCARAPFVSVALLAKAGGLRQSRCVTLWFFRPEVWCGPEPGGDRTAFPAGDLWGQEWRWWIWPLAFSSVETATCILHVLAPCLCHRSQQSWAKPVSHCCCLLLSLLPTSLMVESLWVTPAPLDHLGCVSHCKVGGLATLILSAALILPPMFTVSGEWGKDISILGVRKDTPQPLRRSGPLRGVMGEAGHL